MSRWCALVCIGVCFPALAIDPSSNHSGSVAENSRATPKRIITLAPNTAEIVCELGACDRIIGVSRYCIYPSEIRSRPRIGGFSDPDIERIIALQPDLLVLRGRIESLERLADEQHIALYHDETDTLAGIEKCVHEVGDLLGCSKQAATVNSAFRQRLDEIRKRVKDLGRTRVLLTVSREPGRIANLLTTGRGTFLDEAIEVAGGINVFGHLDMLYPQVSPEAIIAAQPEVIIELMPDTMLSPSIERELKTQWSHMDSLPAVVNDRIYFLNDENCLIPSPRYTAIIDKISRLLHPEARLRR
ncbi:MAG: ABC transporter substrate-binding protein [Planctomycetes bacterium]|nr:ABC transporter substrate-binding protein [Planctomycetota bacterium]MBI3833362.1 ABC transporter substrate-binding protein [Planctomycetota bacterium]